jgi:hypothetical protein
MAAPPVPRQGWFLNRDSHLGAFDSEILGGGRALIFCGAEGIGKSALLEQFRLAASRKGAAALVKLTGVNPVDPFALMHLLGHRIAGEAFQPLRGLLDRFNERDAQIILAAPSPAGEIAIANRSTFIGSSVGTIIGQKIEIDSVTYDQEMARSRRAQRLTEASAVFMDGLVAASAAHKLVLMFDCVHLAGPDLRDWIWNELFAGMAAGRLPNVGIVLTYGAERPPLDGQAATFARIRTLEPLSLDHMVEYVVARAEKMDRGAARTYGEMALSYLKGNLKTLALMLDAWITYNEQQAADP